MKVATNCIAAVLLLAVSGVTAGASVIVFSGEDPGAGPGSAHPNASTAEGNFATAAAALGGISTITFEGAPLGTYASLTAAPGVTLTGTNASGADQSILDVSDFPAAPSLDGFNTTPGGAEWAEMMGGTLTFTFNVPTQFFGAYFSGIQTSFFADTIAFSDGTSEVVNIPGTGTTGSVGALDFVGFTDAGKAISSITINAGSTSSGFDDIGVDDVQFQVAAAASAPEPGSWGLMVAGGVGIALRLRRRRVA